MGDGVSHTASYDVEHKIKSLILKGDLERLKGVFICSQVFTQMPLNIGLIRNAADTILKTLSNVFWGG